MKDYIPLFQTLVWPTFLGCVIWWGRSKFLGLIESIRFRIEQGASFEAGTAGLKIGETQPRLTPTADTRPADHQNPGYYVVHKAKKVRGIPAKGEEPYYKLSIYLVCDPDLELNAVDRVRYKLHPTFRDPNRTVTDASSWFELVTEAWGQFNLEAEIYLKSDPTKPIKVERYLNF